MGFLIFLFTVVIVLPGIYLLLQLHKRRRRKLLESRGLPPKQQRIVARNLRQYDRLSKDERDKLHGFIGVFLAEKEFEGCGGLEINDEIKVTIAAQACLLLLKQEEPSFYPELYSIVIYPSAYVGEELRKQGSEVIEEESVRLGESWSLGTVVLAWDSVKKDTRELSRNRNVVIHEFAHQLDQEDGMADGAPPLEEMENYRTWARVLGEEYCRLRRETQRGGNTLIDSYGAKDPAEFFAVATEIFFENGGALKEKHPKLYNELKEYYHFDTAKWSA